MNGVRLVGGARRLRGADRRDRGGVDEPLDPGREGLLETISGPAHVDVEDGLAVGGAQRRPAGDVEDAVDAVAPPAAPRGGR